MIGGQHYSRVSADHSLPPGSRSRVQTHSACSLSLFPANATVQTPNDTHMADGRDGVLQSAAGLKGGKSLSSIWLTIPEVPPVFAGRPRFRFFGPPAGPGVPCLRMSGIPMSCSERARRCVRGDVREVRGRIDVAQVLWNEEAVNVLGKAKGRRAFSSPISPSV